MFLISEYICVERVWGSDELKRMFECKTDKTIGEVWTLSGYPGYETYLFDTYGNRIGRLDELTNRIVGIKLPRFPILMKVIKARSWLSVQVHPNDDYARKTENEPWGKNEIWYVLDAKNDASLVNGLRLKNKDNFIEVLKKNDLKNYLNFVKVKQNDLIDIRSGKVHTLGPGILILEIQQTSDLTYRIHDWGRGRELHIEKALDVLDFENPNASLIHFKQRYENPYFKLRRIKGENIIHGFCILIPFEDTILNGKQIRKYTSLVIPKDKKVKLNGDFMEVRLGEFFHTYARD